jgi:signal transduction histidine kinase
MGRLTSVPEGSTSRVLHLRRAAVGVALLGAAAVVLLSAQAGMGAPPALELTAWAGGMALITGLLAYVGLRRLDHRSLAVQAVLIAVLPAAGGLVGVWLGARAMFFSDHDLTALVVLLVTAATVGTVAALLLGARVARAGDDLVEATRRLASGEQVPTRATAGSGELDRLARALETTATALEEARQRERALESSRRELIAWVSHDLRTPLAGIRAISEALEDGIAEDPETFHRYLRTLRDEADQLATLVDDLFELSRVQVGQLLQPFEPVSLHDLVSDALAGVTPIADAKGVRVEGRVDGPPLDVEGSHVALLRALRNILENAVRHTPSEGAVIVEAGVDGEHAVVSILDCGGGIPEDDLPRIFDTGFRGDPARTPGGGAGLGLAIALEVVKAHRGDISVHNQDGGAEFVVRVPATVPTVGLDEAQARPVADATP